MRILQKLRADFEEIEEFSSNKICADILRKNFQN